MPKPPAGKGDKPPLQPPKSTVTMFGMQQSRAQALVAIREQMERCDQKATDALIVVAQIQGHHLRQEDFDLLYANLSPKAQAFWADPCECGLPLNHVH